MLMFGGSSLPCPPAELRNFSNDPSSRIGSIFQLAPPSSDRSATEGKPSASELTAYIRDGSAWHDVSVVAYIASCPRPVPSAASRSAGWPPSHRPEKIVARRASVPHIATAIPSFGPTATPR